MHRFSQKILLLTGWRRLLVAIFAGAVSALALAPFHLFIVCFLSFPILVWLLDGAVGRADAGRLGRLMPAFIVGWGFGLGYFTAGLWWIANALLVEAPEFAWAIPLAVLGLPAFLALFYGAATLLARLFWSEGIARLLILAAALGLTEWLRSFVLTGFPWNAIAYAIMPSPLMMQSTAYVGFNAMNILAVLLFALPAGFFIQHRSKFPYFALFIVLLSAHLGVGYWRLNIAAEPEKDGRIIRIVQPSVDQSEKWAPETARRDFDELLALSTAPSLGEDNARPEIIVWPETSVPFILTKEPQAIAAIADALQIGQVLVAGVVREDEVTDQDAPPPYFNSILVLDSDGVIIGAADKNHLVPFGEYLPLKDQLGALGLKAIAAADRGYIAGLQRRSLQLPRGLTAIPLICYEVLFPDELEQIEPTDGLLINVTNDAWYGNTPGPYQHLHQSQLRAVELGMPMVRAANSGISVLVDAKGRIINRLGYNVKGAIDVELPGKLGAASQPHYKRMAFWLLVLTFGLISIITRFSAR